LIDHVYETDSVGRSLADRRVASSRGGPH